MRYEKAETVLRVALDMQGSAYGLTLQDLRNNYSDKPLSRRTAERLRDAVERLFPQVELVNPGELPKRWRIPASTANSLTDVTAEEVADLTTAVSLLRRENMHVQAKSLERVLAKLRALMKRQAAAKLEPDLEALTEAEGLAMRPGPKPKIDQEILRTLREAIITRTKVRLHYLYRGSGKRGYQTVHP
jgi:predicted DNA-binding transcriptional regulator YafY